MGKFIDLTGKRYGKLTVLQSQARRDHVGSVFWLCHCACGKDISVPSRNLVNGNSRSCGCSRMDAIVTHRMSYASVYQAWNGMIQRCYNAKVKSYVRYGGRGIRVCSGLSSSPRQLLDLIGERPSRMTLGRIDNNGHYSCGQCAECVRLLLPLNVRWETVTQQARNKRNNVYVEWNGQKRCYGEWAELLNVDARTIRRRALKGVPLA